VSLSSECTTSFLVGSAIVIVQLVLDGSSQTYLVGKIVFDFANVIVVYALSILGMLGYIPACSTVARMNTLSRSMKLCR